MRANSDFYVGEGEFGGQGSLFVSNATMQARSLTIALGTQGPDGTVEVFGGMTTLFGSLTVGESLLGGSADMLVTGGALLVVTNGGTGIGVGFQSSGIMTISDSTFLTTGIGLGGTRGNAQLFINNGTVTLSGNLEIGTGEQGSGNVFLNGGALIVTNGSIGIGMGDPSADNSLSINGLFLARDIYVIDTFDTSGTLNISGGTSVLTSNLFVGYAAPGTALLSGVN